MNAGVFEVLVSLLLVLFFVANVACTLPGAFGALKAGDEADPNPVEACDPPKVNPLVLEPFPDVDLPVRLLLEAADDIFDASILNTAGAAELLRTRFLSCGSLKPFEFVSTLVESDFAGVLNENAGLLSGALLPVTFCAFALKEKAGVIDVELAAAACFGGLKLNPDEADELLSGLAFDEKLNAGTEEEDDEAVVAAAAVVIVDFDSVTFCGSACPKENTVVEEDCVSSFCDGPFGNSLVVLFSTFIFCLAGELKLNAGLDGTVEEVAGCPNLKAETVDFFSISLFV